MEWLSCSEACEYVLNLTEDAILLLNYFDNDFIVDFANDSFCKLFGTSRINLLGKSSFENSEILKQELQTCANQEASCKKKLYFKSISKGVVVKISKFSHTKFVVTLSPDLKRFEYLEYFNNLVVEKRCVIGEYNEEKNDIECLFWNNHALNLYGYKENDFYGKNLFEMSKIPPLSVRKKLPLLGPDSPSINGEVGHSHYSVNNGEGSLILPQLKYIGINKKNKRKIVAILSDDIVNMNRLEKELKDAIRAYGVLKTIFDNSPVMMGCFVKSKTSPKILGASKQIADDDAEVIVLNPTGQLMFKMENKMTWKQARFPESSRLEWIDQFVRTKKEGKPISHNTKIDLGDKIMWVTCIMVAITATEFTFIAVDITEMKCLQEKLRLQTENLESIVQTRTAELGEALEVRSRFLATMSHEIRTPMNGVLGMISLLNETPVNEEQKEMLRVADLCGHLLMNLINNILELSKLEAQKVQIEKIEIELQVLVEDTLQILSMEAEKKGVLLICELDASVPTKIMGDETRLRQILINLLTNACKFSFGGEIFVRVWASKTQSDKNEYEVCFAVEDQGIGMDEDSQKKILSPFAQADLSINRRFGGTGLGLVICKHLAELMGGKLWFESKLGKGSTFYFQVISTECTFVNTKPNTMLGSVAIISESSRLCNTIKNMIEKSFMCKVIEFANPQEVLNSREKFEIILTNSKYDLNALQSICKRLYTIGRTKFSDFPFLRTPIRQTSLIAALQSQLSNSNTPTLVVPTVSLQNKKILLAEDNIMNQKVVTKMLSLHGYTNLSSAINGKEAFEAVKKEKFDIILMDIMMPEMDGEVATKLIREYEISMNTKPTTILALTADVMNVERYLQIGFDYVITKPIQQSKLIDLLKKVL